MRRPYLWNSELVERKHLLYREAVCCIRRGESEKERTTPTAPFEKNRTPKYPVDADVRADAPVYVHYAFPGSGDVYELLRHYETGDNEKHMEVAAADRGKPGGLSGEHAADRGRGVL